MEAVNMQENAAPRFRGGNSPEGTMPLYEYKCRACAHRFERIVKFSDAPLKTCPKCGADAIEQVISAPAVQFKGSGWYVSDYGRNKKTAPGSSESAKSEGSSETVSASKENGSGNGKSGEPASASSGNASSNGASTSNGGAGSNSGGSANSSSTSPAAAGNASK